MWVSSLVVTLSTQEEQASAVLSALQSIAALTVGDVINSRVPIVVEADAQDSRHWHDWIANLPGVAHMEVAFISFEELNLEEGQLHDQYN